MLKKKKTLSKHPDKLGAGAAKRRELLSGKEKIPVIMKEFSKGTLHSGSGASPRDRLWRSEKEGCRP